MSEFNITEFWHGTMPDRCKIVIDGNLIWGRRYSCRWIFPYGDYIIKVEYPMGIQCKTEYNLWEKYIAGTEFEKLFAKTFFLGNLDNTKFKGYNYVVQKRYTDNSEQYLKGHDQLIDEIWNKEVMVAKKKFGLVDLGNWFLNWFMLPNGSPLIYDYGISTLN